MPVQVARRRANSRRGSRLGRREKRGRTVNFNDELGRGRLGDWKELLRLLYRKLLEGRVTDLTTGSLGRRSFNRIVHQRELPALETDDRMYNLSPGYWVYDDLVADLSRAGGTRLGRGFNGGGYGRPKSDDCIKPAGMGSGD